MLKTSDFDYDLPGKLIAQEPMARRDQSRLMVLDRATGRIGHHVFGELPDLLREGDLMVLNDTYVIPAKFFCRRRTGGRIEGLFLRELSAGRWEVMLKGAGRCKVGEKLIFIEEPTLSIKLENRLGEGLWHVAVSPPRNAAELLERIGATPLPPYIHRDHPDSRDRLTYQTVYAARPGAVAAPTAGLHFTEDVLADLRSRQIESVNVTLHVGLGTFAPVKVEQLSRHKMHSEWYELPAEAAEAITTAKRQGRRIVAVGTTSVRVLETAAAKGRRVAPSSGAKRSGAELVGAPHHYPASTHNLRSAPVEGATPHYCSDSVLAARTGWTDLFIYPPREFRIVDVLLTNFHLPRSTLLMLVAAFCSPGSTDGIKIIKDAYAEAVRQKYRFYSYGDAMLIL